MIGTLEECPECGEETKHKATIEIKQEEDSYHSREPYRVTRCEVCGSQRSTRINS